jgi:hypothetical protein
MKRAKRFDDGGGVGDSNEGMKEAYDYDRAMRMAEVDSKSDYSPKPEITVSNEKTGSTGGSKPTAPKPAPRPAPAPAKTQKAEANPPTKANAAKMDEAAAEMRRESNRGAEKSTSKAEAPSKSQEMYRGFDGKMHKKTESSRPDIGGMIGRGLSRVGSALASAYQKPERYMSATEKESKMRAGSSSYAKGGSVSSASSRGDGIAQRGKTRGKMC